MSVDMSSKAITTRLRCVSELRHVCLALSTRLPPMEVREGTKDYVVRAQSLPLPAHDVTATGSPVRKQAESGIRPGSV
jgi:hypothetical protein